MIAAVLHGVVLAFGLILPLGPQNAFILAQGASHRRFARALPAVAAAGVCDTLLILLAVLGVSVAVMQWAWLRTTLVVAGIGFLAIVGVLLWRSSGKSSDAEAATAWTVRRQVLFTVSVSLLNPHAILDTIGVIGTSSLAYAGAERTAFALACVGVSWAFFLALAVLGRSVASISGARRLLNRGSALVMWICAVYLATSLMGTSEPAGLS